MYTIKYNNQNLHLYNRLEITEVIKEAISLTSLISESIAVILFIIFK